MAKQFTLGKNERLKSRKLIEQLFKEGKSFNAFPFRVYYLLQVVPLTAMPKNSLQFGAGASAKNFKKAVDRNRIKRLAREAYRLQKKLLEETLRTNAKNLSLFFIYTQKELPDYKTVYEKTSLILNKLVKIIDENNPPGT
ncbi:MAG: ribonuclease P protein component [Bacteroidota bacterium]